MTSQFDFSGRTALVTGASSGLGARFARVLAQAVARVVLASSRADGPIAIRPQLLGRGEIVSGGWVDGA